MLWPIIQWMNTLSSFFYSVYLEVNGWVWPFYKAAGLFYSISSVFASLGWDISNFGNWVTSVTSQLLTFINWNTLTSWFNQFLYMITGAWNWVMNWWSNVWNTITTWWPTVIPTIQSWISAATQGFSDLRVAWDNFWKTVLPGLMTVAQWAFLWPLKLLEITGLIDSAFLTRQGFWSGWQEVRDNVVGFISSPLDWLEKKFTDWFLGKE